MKLVLASGSPRRRELLSTLGLEFVTESPGVDESRLPDEPPGVYVERIARDKAAAASGEGRVVIAADTAVVHEGKLMGKPAHPEEARSMLRRLQGDTHDVFTGLAVASWDGKPIIHSTVDVTEVSFMPMTDNEIADYVATGEPMDKAGAYAIQGLGGLFIDAIKGSPFTVVGLPIHLVSRLISSAGADISRFRS